MARMLRARPPFGLQPLAIKPRPLEPAESLKREGLARIFVHFHLSLVSQWPLKKQFKLIQVDIATGDNCRVTCVIIFVDSAWCLHRVLRANPIEAELWSAWYAANRHNEAVVIPHHMEIRWGSNSTKRSFSNPRLPI